MKYIKLKTNRAVSAPFIAYLLSLLFILFLLGQTAFHTVQDAEWSHSLACAWQDLLAYARQKNYLAYAAIRIFPWLLLLWAALFVWERVNGWRTARKTNPITFLKFEKTGVLLGHQKARADVRLPYAGTDLSVTVPVMVAYNKYGHPIHLFGLIEISFSYENKTYSVQHWGKLPFLQTLLDEGKKFRSCSASVRRLNDAKPAGQDELDFIHFLEEQLENHRRYGLLLPVYPVPRALLVGLGIIALAVLEILIGKAFLFLVNNNASLLFPTILCVIGAGLFIWGVWEVKRYILSRLAEKKLRFLKK